MPKRKQEKKKYTVGQVVTIERIQRIALEKNGKELTAKQAKTVQVYAETGNKAEAGRQAYITQTDTGQRVEASRTLAKPYVQNVLVEIMDNIGITDSYLMENIKEGIEKAGIDKKKLDYIETALKIRGHLKNVSVNLSHTIKETRKGYEL